MLEVWTTSTVIAAGKPIYNLCIYSPQLHILQGGVEASIMRREKFGNFFFPFLVFFSANLRIRRGFHRLDMRWYNTYYKTSSVLRSWNLLPAFVVALPICILLRFIKNFDFPLERKECKFHLWNVNKALLLVLLNCYDFWQNSAGVSDILLAGKIMKFKKLYFKNISKLYSMHLCIYI